MAIIGAGDLGGAVAQALATRESADRIVLVDEAASAAAGKALDIQQMCAITGAHPRLRGTADASEIMGCDACVVADRFGPASSEWSGEDGRARLASLRVFVGTAPLLMAGVDQTALQKAAVREAGYRRQQVLGSAAEAYASAVKAIVALDARCAPAEVALSVLGAPSGGLVIPWSEASIGGYALQRVLDPVELGRIEQRAARLWPPRPYALGLAAAQVVEALLRTSRRTHNVFALLDGELGVRDRVASVPAFLDRSGITGVRQPSLSGREQVQLTTALSR